MRCKFICGLSDDIIKTFSQSVPPPSNLLAMAMDSVSPLFSSQVDSAFHPSWDGKMSISLRAE